MGTLNTNNFQFSNFLGWGKIGHPENIYALPIQIGLIIPILCPVCPCVTDRLKFLASKMSPTYLTYGAQITHFELRHRLIRADGLPVHNRGEASREESLACGCEHLLA